MRIHHIDISGFGRWQQQTVTLDTHYQVISGPNEAGKTTLRQLITGILFGFPARRAQHADYTPKSGARFGGALVVVLADQRTYRISRLGRPKATLTVTCLTDNVAIADPDLWLHEQLGGLSQADFEQVFSLSQHDLPSLQNATPESLQQQLLTIGGIGQRQWLTQAETLEQAANAYLTPRSKNRPYDIAVAQHQTLAKKARQAAADQPDYQALCQKMADQEAALTATEQQQAALQAELAHCRQQAQQAALIAEYHDKQASLKVPAVLVSAHDYQVFQTQQAGLAACRSTMQTAAQEPETPSQRQALDDLLATAQQAARQERDQQDQQAEADRFAQQFTAQSCPNPLTDRELAQLTTPPRPWYWALLVPLVVVALGILGHFAGGSVFILGALATLPAVYIWQRARTQQVARDQLLAPYAPWSLSAVVANQPLVHRYAQAPEGASTLSAAEWCAAVADQIPACQLSPATTWALRAQMLQTHRLASATVPSVAPERLRYEQALADLYRQCGVADAAALEAAYRQTEAYQKNRQRLTDIAKQLTVPVDQLLDGTTLDAKIATLASQLQALAHRQQHDRQILADDRAQAKQLVSDERIRDLQQQLANQTHDLTTAVADYLVNQLTARWIRTSLQLASAERFPNMLITAGEYLAEMTDNAYVALTIDAQHWWVDDGDTQWALADLSTGTQDAVFIALRLALATVVCDVVGVPFIFDDTFMTLDESRQQNVHQLLKSLSAQQQMIYFTHQSVTDPAALILTAPKKTTS